MGRAEPPAGAPQSRSKPPQAQQGSPEWPQSRRCRARSGTRNKPPWTKSLARRHREEKDAFARGAGATPRGQRTADDSEVVAAWQRRRAGVPKFYSAALAGGTMRRSTRGKPPPAVLQPPRRRRPNFLERKRNGSKRRISSTKKHNAKKSTQVFRSRQSPYQCALPPYVHNFAPKKDRRGGPGVHTKMGQHITHI